MRIQWKMLLLVSLVLVGAVSAITWKTRTLLIRDKRNFISDAAANQIAPLKRLVLSRMDEQKTRMVKFAAGRAALGAGKIHLPEGFDAMALMAPSQATQQWSPTWVEKNPTVHADLPSGFELTILKSLPYSKVRDGEIHWARVSDRQGAPVYALMISVEVQAPAAPTAVASGASEATALPENVEYNSSSNPIARKAIVVGLISLNPLADITEDYIGSTNSVYLVDDKGYVASHVNKAYLGALFSEDPIVAEILSGKKSSASGNYEDLESRPVIGRFEKVDRTNLYAVISTPLLASQELLKESFWTSIQAGAVVGILGLLLTLIVSRSISEPIKEATEAIRAINRGEPLVVRSTNSKDEVGALMRLLVDSSPAALASKASFGNQAEAKATREDTDSGSAQSRVVAIAASQDRLAQERKAAYEMIKDGMSTAIKEPLLAILGHAQLAKAKASTDEVRSHAESIEREARRASLVIDRLSGWTPDATKGTGVETMDLAEVMESVLSRRADELHAEGVFVSKEIHKVPKVRGSFEQMSVVFSNLVDNALEAMKARAKKHLHIQLEFLNDKLFLVVTDTGVGMSRDIKERAFEPFFKGFDSQDRVGLGLAMVHGAIESLGGTCSLESTPGEGATVTLKIPVSAEEKQLFRLAETAPPVEPPLNVSAESVPTTHSENAVVEPPARSTPLWSDVPPPREEIKLPPLPERPAGASVRDVTESAAQVVKSAAMDDDEDEDFQAVTLLQQVKSELDRSEESPSTGPEKENFHVKIRRPRLRS